MPNKMHDRYSRYIWSILKTTVSELIATISPTSFASLKVHKAAQVDKQALDIEPVLWQAGDKSHT